ncbi:hypothetical protein SBA2_490004 [Acidobacteriia bacterium SbA2]|nr:hypothetical protein SBA2_490004 [Acidobacteriia bacterium SbA2]
MCRPANPIGVNSTPQVVAIKVSLTANTGPEGRQGVAHGVSRGTGEPPPVISAPEGRQWPPREICRPFSGAVNISAAFRPTAHAVGYFLAPLRGSRSPGTLS